MSVRLGDVSGVVAAAIEGGRLAMKIGFTGTRKYLTREQENNLYSLLKRLGNLCHFHHGDCFGADDRAAQIADSLGMYIVKHPPLNKRLCAYNHTFNEVRPAKSFLERDRDIVDECEMLIVCPKENEWQSSGGTWYTHDYACKQPKLVVILFPDGRCVDKEVEKTK